jgi:hypothetical protein
VTSSVQSSDCNLALVVIVRIDKKYSTLLLAAMMTVAMDFTMTLTMTATMTGIDPAFPLRFAGGFLIGFVVGFPTSLLVIPAVRRIVSKLTADQPSLRPHPV